LINRPIIHTGELARQRELFESVIGIRYIAEDHLDHNAVRVIFGPVAARVILVQLATPGSDLGIWLVAFEPASEIIIREGGVGVACNALKMIDFFTADRSAVTSALRRHRFEILAEGASVDLPDGSRFLEAHAKGPDGVMIAAIEPLNVRAADFVTVTDRPFSEVQSLSGPVSDFESVCTFYEDVLGVPMGFCYEFTSESFSRMVGVERILHNRANNYGRVVEDVMLGLIYYGLPAGTYVDLHERTATTSRDPRRTIARKRPRFAAQTVQRLGDRAPQKKSIHRSFVFWFDADRNHPRTTRCLALADRTPSRVCQGKPSKICEIFLARVA